MVTAPGNGVITEMTSRENKHLGGTLLNIYIYIYIYIYLYINIYYTSLHIHYTYYTYMLYTYYYIIVTSRVLSTAFWIIGIVNYEENY